MQLSKEELSALFGLGVYFIRHVVSNDYSASSNLVWLAYCLYLELSSLQASEIQRMGEVIMIHTICRLNAAAEVTAYTEFSDDTHPTYRLTMKRFAPFFAI
jgi:hypothetical protein